ncbi:MAG: hypothetical protein PVJ64_00905 [Gemmatimonadales bacterium]|jgi:hypothetical protein
MLFALFVIVAVTLIVAHHFLIVRPRQREAALRDALSGRGGPPAVTLTPVPPGVFLQSNYTWSQITPSGELLLGVHPLLLNLAGASQEIEVVPEERVERGMPLFRLRKNDRQLTVNSPVTGKLRVARELVDGETGWEEISDGNRWLCRVEPEHVEDEISTWMSGDRAEAWSSGQYAEIRDHLLALGADTQLGATLVDGGEIRAGALAQLDQAEWEAFEERFLHG